MAVTVIKRVETENWKKQQDCSRCSSTLEFGLSDLTKQSSRNDCSCYFHCPVCRGINYIKLQDIESKYHFAIKEEQRSFSGRD